MGAEDIVGKAQQFLNDEKTQSALHSSQAEDVSDKLLDGVADLANKITGNKFEEQIDGARDAADGAIGDK